MKNILGLLVMVFLMFSCGSTKEMQDKEEVEQVGNVRTSELTPQTLQKAKRGGVNPEQIAAQLGLSTEQEQEFIPLWESTAQKMKTARIENKGNKDLLISSMQEIKSERMDGLERILTNAQMEKFYKIMRAGRGNADSKLVKKRG